MMKKLLSLTAVAIVTIGVAAYAIGYEKFKINDASDYVSEYVLEFDANTNKPTNLDSTHKNDTYKAYTKDHNEITIKYENASVNPNGYINLGQGGSILNPYIEGGYGNNRISSIMSIAVNFTGDLRLSLSAFGSVYGLTGVSLTSGEPYKVTDEILYSYFKLEASLHTSIQSMSIRYSCEYVDTVEFEFTKLDNGYELTHYNGDGGDVVIPDTYLGLPVISIGNSAFEDCESLISVTIPSSVTSIGEWAFYNCSSLTSITIPNGVTSIGSSAFYNCDSLTSIIIPDSVTAIGDHAFSNCSSLTSITIPDSVTTIGSSAFSSCNNLTIYCEVTSKPSGWDSSWNSYRPVVWDCLNAKRTEDGLVYHVYENEDETKYIVIDAYIGTATDVLIPDTINVDAEEIKVTTIGDYAFSNNDTITSVTIGNNVTSIGSHAFYNCDSLTLITIPDSVTSIGSYAFLGCSSLTIYCEAASKPSGWNSDWNPSNRPVVWVGGNIIVDGDYAYVVRTDGEERYVEIVRYLGSGGEVVIPDTINVDAEEIKVTTIGERAFYDDDTITSVTIGNNVTSIGERAFYDCDSLTSIIIPDSVTIIGEYAFYWCSNLTIYCEATSKPSGWSSSWNSSCPVVWVGGDIIVDGDYAYVVRADSEERYVEIVRYLGSGGEVVIPDTINVDGVNIPVTTIGERAFYYCNSLTTVTIGENSQLTTIGISAFYNCSSLTSIIIPDSVTSIGNSAFSFCSSLTIYCEATSKPSGWDSWWNSSNRPVVWDCLNAKRTEDGLVYHVYENEDETKYIVIDAYIGTATDVLIPDTINVDAEEIKVTTIGDYAFSNNDTITSVTIGNNVTSIGSHAFYNCDSLTSITIPDSVTTIGSYAFYNCDSLTSIIIPDSVTTIGSYAFENCYNLTTVTIGENSQLTSIGEWAFYNCSSLTSITIPNGVTSIGSYAFENCYNLTTVTFGENSQLTSIGERAFYNCDSLTSIIIPDSVTSIGEWAFYWCSNLTTVTFGENSQLTSIGEWAFYGCDSLISITIPDSVTTIGRYAFRNCDNLTIYCEAASKPSGWSPYWNDSNRPVVWVGGDIFVDGDYAYVVRTDGEERYVEIVTYLGSGGEVVIPDTINVDAEEIKVTTIGSYAFYNCDSLTSITIPDSVTTIGESAFEDCSSLTTVTFGENSQLTSIGEWAFYNCSSLTSITIPNGVTSIGSRAFEGCSSLTIYCEATSQPSGWNSNWNPSNRPVVWDCLNAKTTEDGFVYYLYENDDGTKYIVIDSYIGTATDVLIPDTINVNGEDIPVTTIGESAFEDCSSLTSITIPDSVTSIGERAFSGCFNLTSVTFGENSQLTSIGEWAFYGCSSLTSIVIPNSVTSIGSYAFEYCSSLTSITIPDSVTSIGNYAFYNCSSLTTVTFGENSQLTTIGNYAFYNCSSLTTVTFGENSQLTSIGDYAFYSCDSLTSITIPDSVTSIGEYAFYNCDSLTSITIPDSVTTIGSYAFSGCSSITIYCEVTSKPSGWSPYWNDSDRPVVWGYTGINGEYSGLKYVVSIDSEGNKYITIIGYSGTDNDVTVPDTINVDGVNIPVTTVGNYAFSNNDTITSVTIGNNVTSIGSHAFYNCDSLILIIIPDSVTTIGESAFEDCSSLTSIIIPDSVTSIGNYAFYNCSSLTTVTFGENSQLTSIGEWAFYNCSSLTSITIPNGVTSIGSYAFEYCSSLTSIIIPDSVTTIGNSVFFGCSSLTIYCEAASKPSGWNSDWKTSNRPVVWVGGNIIVDGDYAYVVRTDGEERYVEIVRYLGSGGEVVISDTINVDAEEIPVATIGSYAFSGCSSLTSITIPDSVASIGERAFYNCDSLTSIIIPDSVTSIGFYAFEGCSSLTIYCEATSQPSGWSPYWNPSNRPVVWDCLNAKTTEDGLVYSCLWKRRWN